MWCRMLWTICSAETDDISSLMMTFLLLKVVCMHGSSIKLLTPGNSAIPRLWSQVSIRLGKLIVHVGKGCAVS